MTVGSHPSPTAPEADIKTFPPPPNYRKNRRLYRRACFRKFSKLSGTKVQNVKTGVLSFLTSGKGVNTWTDNLRVHTAGFDIDTMSVRTTTRSGWLEWRSHGCPKVTGTTSHSWTTQINFDHLNIFKNTIKINHHDVVHFEICRSFPITHGCHKSFLVVGKPQWWKSFLVAHRCPRSFQLTYGWKISFFIAHW